MRTHIVYESIYGTTHLTADAIGRGRADGGASSAAVSVASAAEPESELPLAQRAGIENRSRSGWVARGDTA
jgi:hypothetical protein